MTKDHVLDRIYAERGGEYPHNTDDTWRFDQIAEFVLRMVEEHDKEILIALLSEGLTK